MKTELINMFNQTVKEFVDDIKIAFPELDLDKYDIIDMDTIEYIDFFISNTTAYANIISQKSDKIKEIESCYVLPELDLKSLMCSEGLSDENADIIWKYIHRMMLLSATYNAPSDDLEKTIEEWSKLLENEDGEQSEEFLESIKQQAETLFNLLGQFNDDEDVNMFADLDDEVPNMFSDKSKSNSDGMSNDDDDDDDEDDNEDDDENAEDDVKSTFDKLQNSKVGKLAQELAKEVNLEDFVNSENTSKNAKDAFKNFLGKDPKKLMGLVKTVSDKVKSKLASGEINEPELVEEVQDMVASLKNNKKFKKACRRNGMGDIFEKAMNAQNGNGNVDPAQMDAIMRAMMSNKRPQKTTVRDRLQKKIETREMLTQKESVVVTDNKYNTMSVDEIALDIENSSYDNLNRMNVSSKKGKLRKNNRM
tara:strand:+ start:1048 stop:2310 length:1263 start_codon:yes stop_codon:yes gene_type:complete